jgi:hypothetical protein
VRRRCRCRRRSSSRGPASATIPWTDARRGRRRRLAVSRNDPWAVDHNENLSPVRLRQLGLWRPVSTDESGCCRADAVILCDAASATSAAEGRWKSPPSQVLTLFDGRWNIRSAGALRHYHVTFNRSCPLKL